MSAVAILAVLGWYAAVAATGFLLIEYRYARELERLNEECHDGWSDTIDQWRDTIAAWAAADRRRYETYDMDRRQL